ARAALVAAFRTAPAPLQLTLARALAQDREGAKALMQAIADGKAPARLLLEASVKNLLAAANVPELQKQIKNLTQGLPAPAEKLAKIMSQRRAAYLASTPSIDAGEKFFVKTCAICHQIAGQGKVIGPQLDGIGSRGLDRLIEDVLDPNRNVDPAFRT